MIKLIFLFLILFFIYKKLDLNIDRVDGTIILWYTFKGKRKYIPLWN